MPFTIYRGGRRPPHPDSTHPRLWIDRFMPEPGRIAMTASRPQSADWASAITAWPMDLNNELGTCGIAGMDHLQMGLAAYGGTTAVTPWGDQVTMQLYEILGGYRPGDPSTDSGTVLQDNLTWWRHNPVQGSGILGFAAVSPGLLAKPERISLLRTFGPLYLGLNLPQSAEAQFPGIWTWDPASPLAGGHCVTEQAEAAAGPGEVEPVSWGQRIRATMEFLRRTCEEAWVAIDAAAIERNGANQYGYDMPAINEALASLTGQANPLRLTTIR